MSETQSGKSCNQVIKTFHDQNGMFHAKEPVKQFFVIILTNKMSCEVTEELTILKER